MMSPNVRDDRATGAQGTGRVCGSLVLRVGIAAVAALAIAGGASAADLGLTVKELDGANAHRITIPVNKSVIVETIKPIKRAQSVETGIAKVESLSAKQQIVTGVAYGTTEIIFWAENDEREVLDVQVELDLGLLNEKLKEIDPQSNALAASIKGHIVLTGTVSGAIIAEQMERFATLFVPGGGAADAGSQVQNHLMVAGQQQVMLRCTVAEVNRRALRRLGVDGFMAGDDFKDVFAVSQIGGFNPINIGAAANVNATSTIPFLTGEDGIPLSQNTTFSLGFPRVQMQVFMKALQENSLLKILAEPDLVAISGETASFLAGGEFPIPVPQSGAATGAITIDFREFGVRVNFTPVVLAQQRIRLKVAPEVSETDFSTAVQIQGFLVPGLTQRRVETTVEVGNGQTLAVAGLLADEVRGVASKIPALGEVPVLGALFRSVEYQRRETELVVLVTPEIVAPLNPQQVPPVPGENHVTPNDFELYGLAKIEGEEDEENNPPPPAGAVYETPQPPKVAPLRAQPSDSSLQGPWGYSSPTEQ